MRQFQDSQGRNWSLPITAASVRRVHDLLGVDLRDTGPVCEQMAGDIALLANVLFVVCIPQAEALGVTDEQFGQALHDPAGKVIREAADALMQALVDLHPRGPRSVLQGTLDRSRAIESEFHQQRN